MVKFRSMEISLMMVMEDDNGDVVAVRHSVETPCNVLEKEMSKKTHFSSSDKHKYTFTW